MSTNTHFYTYACIRIVYRFGALFATVYNSVNMSVDPR
jgi:hypothetical protein